MLMPTSNGRLADFLLGVAAFECPKGHRGELGAQLEYDFDSLTVGLFRETLNGFARGFEHVCEKCRKPVRAENLLQARFFLTFDDGSGTVIAWWTRDRGSFEIAYHAETRPDRLLEGRPAKLRDLVPVTYTDARNDDCRGTLGRVLSLRTRWLEFIERFAQTQRTIVDVPAPGLAIGLHTPERAAEFRALLGVLLPGYDPRERHMHVPLEGDGDDAPGGAREWLTAEARTRLKEYRAIPIAIYDRWTLWEQVEAQARRFGTEVEPYRLRRGVLSLEFEFEEIGVRAVRQCRTLGEQAYVSLAPAAATLARASGIIEAASPSDVRADWTMVVDGREHDLARLAEEFDPSKPGDLEKLNARLKSPVS